MISTNSGCPQNAEVSVQPETQSSTRASPTTLRFKDLSSAGRDLAAELESRQRDAAIVLGLARGGVPVAAAVASHLQLPLDVVLIRRLLAPHGPNDPLCAFSIAGSLVLDPEVEARSAAEATVKGFVAEALAQLALREKTCRRERFAIDLTRKNIILVDNGIQTGWTMRAVVRALRTAEPAHILAAVPVSSLAGQAIVAPLVDEFVCLATPAPFGHVGLWYKEFMRPEDEEIATILDSVDVREPS